MNNYTSTDQPEIINKPEIFRNTTQEDGRGLPKTGKEYEDLLHSLLWSPKDRLEQNFKKFFTKDYITSKDTLDYIMQEVGEYLV